MLAATPEDAWTVAIAICARVSGDPGYVPLQGAPGLPLAAAPTRLGLLQTAGSPKASEGARRALVKAQERLSALGISIRSRVDDPSIEKLEQAIRVAVPITFQIGDWEWLWPVGTYAKRTGLSQAMRKRLNNARNMRAG